MVPERLTWLLDPAGDPVDLAGLFSVAGHELYVVGGSVRDLLLGGHPTDLDFTTDATPAQVKLILQGWADEVHTVGETFGTIGATRRGHAYEITTFREEVYRDDSRKPHVTFSHDIGTDLSRRDFTINAMALRLPSPELVDPHGGLKDLAARLLRTPLTPEVSFGDDPLRMLRLFRFVATLGFSSEARALAAVGSMGDRLRIVSAERVQAELSKLLLGEQVEEALGEMVESGLGDFVIPELSALKMEQDPIHRHKDVLAHTLAVVAKTHPKLELRLAALFHDIGKPATRDVGPEGVSFHHHEVVGARTTKTRLKELRYPSQVVEDVSRLVYLHLRPHTFGMGWTDSAVRRYVRDTGPLLDDLNHLVRCDVTTANPQREREIQARLDDLEARIEVLRQREELASLRPPIDGHAVMSYLDIAPGPRVGEVIELLTEHRIEHGPYPEVDAYRIVRAWALERGMADPGEPPA
ncbi:MAG TPA: CCA tRNA nucleotidyltransferase [Acidimicrobiia bacterium]